MHVELICDSMSANGIRLTTFVITGIPSYMLLELLPIRELSVTRWTNHSGRTTLSSVVGKPAIPDFGASTPFGVKNLNTRWTEARTGAVEQANRMLLAPEPASSSDIDRLLFAHSTSSVVVTSSKWLTAIDQINEGSKAFGTIGAKIQTLLATNKPNKLEEGAWHLPFVDKDDLEATMRQVSYFFGIEFLSTPEAASACLGLLIKSSVSRCASCTPILKDRDAQLEFDMRPFLEGDAPKVFAGLPRTAFDHQAVADTIDEDKNVWRNPNLHGNLPGWCQYREVFKWEMWKN